MNTKSIPVVLPLDICEGCERIDPVIGSKPLLCDGVPSFTEFYAGCEYEEFCKYIYKRLKKKEELNNAAE